KMPFPEDPAGAESAERESLLQLLAAGPGLVLLGHPGSGKSTFLKYVVLLLAQGRGGELGLAGDRPPGLLSLPGQSQACGSWRLRGLSVADFFARRCAELHGEELPFDALLRQAARTGRVVWLLDGLDEVRGEAERLALVGQLESLLSARRESGSR